MIQRKQSIWLLLAALLNAGVLFCDLYRMQIDTHTIINGTDTVVNTTGQLRVGDHFPSLMIVLVMSILPLVAIFMYGNRKRQIRLSAVALLATASFITMTLFRVTNLAKQIPAPTSGNYWLGSIFPVVALVFLVLAILGIRKDEKLVRSVDRLR
jgi:FtsH-binding integral membrane protein